MPSGTWWIDGCNYSSKVTTLTEKLENQEALPVFRATLIRTDALLTLPRWGKVKNNPTADILGRSDINRNKAPFMSFFNRKESHHPAFECHGLCPSCGRRRLSLVWELQSEASLSAGTCEQLVTRPEVPRPLPR